MLRRFFITASLVMLCASATHGDEIAVFSDPGASTSKWTDEATALQMVYVYHLISDGATAAEWQLYPPATWTHLGDGCDIWCIGSSITGISIPYEACLTGMVRVLVVNFMGYGSEPPCTAFYIGGYHGQPSVNCADELYDVPGGLGFVNWDDSCPPVPVKSTTWGAIKALYR